jgi:hypothetical protein
MSAGKHRKPEGILRLWKRNKWTPAHSQIRQSESVSVGTESSETIPNLIPIRTGGASGRWELIPAPVSHSESVDATGSEFKLSADVTGPADAVPDLFGRLTVSLVGFVTRALTHMGAAQFPTHQSLTLPINEDAETDDGVHHRR